MSETPRTLKALHAGRDDWVSLQDVLPHMPMLETLEIWAHYDWRAEGVEVDYELRLAPELWQLTRLTRLILDPVAGQRKDSSMREASASSGDGEDPVASNSGSGGQEEHPVASISEGIGNLTGLSELRLTGQWLALPASFSRLMALRSLVLGLDVCSERADAVQAAESPVAPWPAGCGALTALQDIELWCCRHLAPTIVVPSLTRLVLKDAAVDATAQATAGAANVADMLWLAERREAEPL